MQELDSKIIDKAITGDKMAFRSIVIHYGKTVNNLAYRYTNNHSTAEDIAQETFIKAFKALHGYQHTAKFSTWLYRITSNASIDHIRKYKKSNVYNSYESEHEDQESQKQQFSEQLDMNQQIQKALGQLTVKERLAFTMKHHQGFSIDETAEKLKIKPNACKQTIYRAVQKLRKQLVPMVSS